MNTFKQIESQITNEILLLFLTGILSLKNKSESQRENQITKTFDLMYQMYIFFLNQ